MNDSDLLLAAAARLYSIGIDLEAARENLRQLVANKVPYVSGQMADAYRDFCTLKYQWDTLEREYLRLRADADYGGME